MSQKKIEENNGENPIKTLNKEQTKKMNDDLLKKNTNLRNHFSDYMGSDKVKKSFYNKNIAKCDFDKGEKITNNNDNSLIHAANENKKHGCFKKSIKKYVVGGNQISYI